VYGAYDPVGGAPPETTCPNEEIIPIGTDMRLGSPRSVCLSL